MNETANRQQVAVCWFLFTMSWPALGKSQLHCQWITRNSKAHSRVQYKSFISLPHQDSNSQQNSRNHTTKCFIATLHKHLVRRCEGKWPLGRSRRRW